MSSEEFNVWCTSMLYSGKAKNMTHLAKLLGIDRTTLYAMAKRGGNRRDMLACMALLYGIGEGK